MRFYLEGYKILHPTLSITPYHHMSLHLPEFLGLMGPWRSWGMGPYETMNGMAQKIPTNDRFGEYMAWEYVETYSLDLRGFGAHDHEQIQHGFKTESAHIQSYATSRDIGYER